MQKIQLFFNTETDEVIRVHGAEMRYPQKHAQILGFGYFSHVLQDISATRTGINLYFAAFKACYKAGALHIISSSNIYVKTLIFRQNNL